MAHRQAFYKYIMIVIVLATCLEFPRFFEMKLVSVNDQTTYWTTSLDENPYYIQFNSYWNELIVTGFLPLITLCYINFRIFLKIKVSLYRNLTHRFECCHCILLPCYRTPLNIPCVLFPIGYQGERVLLKNKI